MDNNVFNEPPSQPEKEVSSTLFYGEKVQSFIQPESMVGLPQIEETAETTSRWRSSMRELVETLILALLLFVVINTLSIRIQVDGYSMNPTFDNEDMVIVNRIAYKFDEIERGDIVVFALPQNLNEDYIKRVIGISGDTIRINDGLVYVNGFPLHETYIKEPPLRDLDERVVPEGSVFVMGDNRNDSNDSRAWGSLPEENIIGKAFFVYYPFDNLGMVEHPEIFE